MDMPRGAGGAAQPLDPMVTPLAVAVWPLDPMVTPSPDEPMETPLRTDVGDAAGAVGFAQAVTRESNVAASARTAPRVWRADIRASEVIGRAMIDWDNSRTRWALVQASIGSGDNMFGPASAGSGWHGGVGCS
jgi:hypothetical protein